MQLAFSACVAFIAALHLSEGYSPSASVTGGVLCHGEALFDYIADVSCAGWDLERMSREGTFRPYPGGAPANVACALSKLGTKAYFCGAVGDDDDGRVLQQVFDGCQVDTALFRKLRGERTRRCMVTRDEQGDREFAGFGDGLPSESFADCSHELTENDMDFIAGKVSWSVQGTLGLAFPKSAESHHALVREMKACSVNCLIDINWRPVFWKSFDDSEARKRIVDFARYADVLKMTDDEAAWLFGVSPDKSMSNPSRIRSNFPNCKVLLLTGGAKGCSYDFLGHCGYVEPYPVKVVETTGAGDAFNAGFLHSVLGFDLGDGMAKDRMLSEEEKSEVDDALQFASAVGALTCTSDGAIDAQPTLSRVLEFMGRK